MVFLRSQMKGEYHDLGKKGVFWAFWSGMYTLSQVLSLPKLSRCDARGLVSVMRFSALDQEPQSDSQNSEACFPAQH